MPTTNCSDTADEMLPHVSYGREELVNLVVEWVEPHYTFSDEVEIDPLDESPPVRRDTVNNDTQKAALLRRAFAPWDARALEDLAEAHPDTAAAVEELVAEGLIEPDDLRQYAVEQGYLESTGAWLARAAAHVYRRVGRNEDGRAAPPSPDDDDAT